MDPKNPGIVDHLEASEEAGEFFSTDSNFSLGVLGENANLRAVLPLTKLMDP